MPKREKYRTKKSSGKIKKKTLCGKETKKLVTNFLSNLAISPTVNESLFIPLIEHYKSNPDKLFFPVISNRTLFIHLLIIGQPAIVLYLIQNIESELGAGFPSLCIALLASEPINHESLLHIAIAKIDETNKDEKKEKWLNLIRYLINSVPEVLSKYNKEKLSALQLAVKFKKKEIITLLTTEYKDKLTNSILEQACNMPECDSQTKVMLKKSKLFLDSTLISTTTAVELSRRKLKSEGSPHVDNFKGFTSSDSNEGRKPTSSSLSSLSCEYRYSDLTSSSGELTPCTPTEDRLGKFDWVKTKVEESASMLVLFTKLINEYQEPSLTIVEVDKLKNDFMNTLLSNNLQLLQEHFIKATSPCFKLLSQVELFLRNKMADLLQAMDEKIAVNLVEIERHFREVTEITTAPKLDSVKLLAVVDEKDKKKESEKLTLMWELFSYYSNSFEVVSDGLNACSSSGSSLRSDSIVVESIFNRRLIHFSLGLVERYGLLDVIVSFRRLFSQLNQHQVLCAYLAIANLIYCYDDGDLIARDFFKNNLNFNLFKPHVKKPILPSEIFQQVKSHIENIVDVKTLYFKSLLLTNLNVIQSISFLMTEVRPDLHFEKLLTRVFLDPNKSNLADDILLLAASMKKMSIRFFQTVKLEEFYGLGWTKENKKKFF